MLARNALPPLLAIWDRYSAYLDSEIPEAISEHDTMYLPGTSGSRDHYFAVGRSAVDIIVGAMMTARKTDIKSVLDLPCGAGRVTRHLRALFPEADLYVNELHKERERFAVDNFGAKPLPPDHDFTGKPERTFDLIFVGSLLTHFDEVLYRRSLGWFINALEPDGLLVATVHGREFASRQRAAIATGIAGYHPRERWEPIERECAETGFGFWEHPTDPTCGVSLNSPSWLMRAIEGRPNVKIVGFHEAAWDGLQDAVVLQRR
jgi:SAM-dependent methyltransferase